ncbi:CG42337 [Drosophila busckii]|uniref:CG42337 n=1 Tax=Drosophila busckii TaxID=30019 RepID=A0A0M4EGD8_DROBS|nr:CG42337 [Drosophila busckii]
MSDRYSSYYEHLHPAQAQAAMSSYAAAGYRGGYASAYNPYGYGYAGATAGAGAYMPNYYRYAPYASPHYSQPTHHAHPHPHHHAGMFTPAGQQLIPSSVLHYPPRPPVPYAHTHNAYQQASNSYEPPAPAPYSAAAYGRSFGAYQSATPTHYAPTGRAATPAPNRTVLPPNYLESLRHEEPHSHTTPKLEEPANEADTEAGSPTQRLTTSPPMISATGTDSDDISATAATPTPTATSASPATPTHPIVNDIDKTETAAAEAAASEEQQPEINLAQATTATPQDIHVAEQQQQQQQQQQEQQQHSLAATNQIKDDAAVESEQEQQQQQLTATIAASISHNWSPTPTSRRSRTPPAPQNSPVGYGLTPHSVPPALAPLLQQQQEQLQQQQQSTYTSSKRHASAKNRNNNNSINNNSSSSSRNCNSSHNNNRIIECDLIPSKKSKRKTNKRPAGSEPIEAMESTVREQIRQAFGSTEIGRFSERFLQTPESLVERQAEDYAGSYYDCNNMMPTPTPNLNVMPSVGHSYAAGAGGMQGYWPYEEQYYNQHMSRQRMRGQGYPYVPDYAAYERYGYAAYNASRSRYNEIRCNGY